MSKSIRFLTQLGNEKKINQKQNLHSQIKQFFKITKYVTFYKQTPVIFSL